MDYTVCNPIEGLQTWNSSSMMPMQHIQRHATTEAELPELGEGEDIDTSIPADPDVKNYSYTVVDGDGVLPGKQPHGAA